LLFVLTVIETHRVNGIWNTGLWRMFARPARCVCASTNTSTTSCDWEVQAGKVSVDFKYMKFFHSIGHLCSHIFWQLYSCFRNS